ncbi:MAG TPA: YdeI/OmpD-associated family protein [Catalimonadaceae bacterium]|nr:YdeI/OmpD-associated family protein [Catalimonadaceae bacterium]HPI12163.1 YdeI/OmpD-associated family protein [Catalimonadaceae bacterium]
MEKNPKVDFYFKKAGKWEQETLELRRIALSCGLTEELKWGTPCYTIGKKNIVLIHDFKEYCALLFFKGALLKNEDQLLVSQTENTQSTRQIRFTHLDEILAKESAVLAHILEAIEIEKAGKKVELKSTEEFPVPEEFQELLNADPEIEKAFRALTPGRQRGYLLHFGAPKQSATRVSRIEKCLPQIMAGKGLND